MSFENGSCMIHNLNYQNEWQIKCLFTRKDIWPWLYYTKGDTRWDMGFVKPLETCLLREFSIPSQFNSFHSTGLDLSTWIICKQYIGHLCFKFWVTNEIIYKATSGQIMSSHQCKYLSFCLHCKHHFFLNLIFVLIQTLQDKVHPKKRSHKSEGALWIESLAINLCKYSLLTGASRKERVFTRLDAITT